MNENLERRVAEMELAAISTSRTLFCLVVATALLAVAVVMCVTVNRHADKLQWDAIMRASEVRSEYLETGE